MGIEYNSQSFQQGYWVGRGELRDEDVTAPKDESYREGALIGSAEQGVVFVDGVAVGDYTPTFHSLADLETGNVERVPDDE